MNQNRLHQLIKSLNPVDCVQAVLAHRRLTLAGVVALTLLLAAFIPSLAFKTSVHDLIIEDLPENTQYKAFKAIFGSEEIIRVVIKCDNVFDPLNFQKITQMEAAAKTIPGVQRVIGLPGIKNTVDLSGNWPMEKFVAFVSGVDLFKRNLISEDHDTTVITLVLGENASQPEVIDAVGRLIAATGTNLRLYQIGMPLISQALAHFTQRDFLRLPPLTFLLIALVLLLIFRNAAYAFIPLSCIAICLIWTFGIVAILEVPLSILTMIVPVFLIAVGTAYCLHILAEFRTAATPDHTSAQAATIAFSRTSLPTLLAILTTLFGLASLFINRISAIREFALFTCIGMVIFLILVLTYLPVVLSFIPCREKAWSDKNRTVSLMDRFINWIIDLNLHHQRMTLIVLAGMVLFAGFGLLRLRAETNPIGYFKDDTQVIKNFHDIYRQLSGSFPVNVVMTSPAEDYFESAENIARIEKLQQFLDTLPGVDKTISFADYLKLVNYASNRFEPAYYKLPTESWELRMLMNTYKSMLGMDLFNAFMGPALSQANILLLTHISSSKGFLDLRQTILRHVGEAFERDLNWNVTGFGMVISASSHHLVVGQVKSLFLTMAVIYMIMFVLFLSSKVGLIAIVPNLFPIIINFGLMGWMGIELSMATSLIASIAIGLAVDDTIHYLVRFNHEFKKDLDDKRALKETMAHIGRPVIFTTLTISAGFFILAFSSFKPTAIFGTMMVITMLSALVGDLVLLPILMQRVELVTLWDLVRIKMGGKTGLGIPLFQGLSRAEVHSTIMAGTLKQVKAGEILFYKGDQSESMYAIISGRFDVIDYDPTCTLRSPEGIQKCIAKIGTGDILGEMGLLRSAPRSATVMATEDSELLPINWKVIQRLQWLYPPTAHKFFVNMMRILCDRVERLTTCLANESLVDDLSGLNNRKGFIRCLKQEANRAHRRQETLILTMIRVRFDDAAAGNQLHGIKNNILRGIGDTLNATIRCGDMVGRVDTNTFAVLVSSEARKDADVLTQRLRMDLEKMQTSFEKSVAFTMTFNAVVLGLKPDNDGERLLDETLHKIETENNPLVLFIAGSAN
ncbi:MMPL family transporter [Desulfosarcina sp.]|uniref:MMPL family transporter n=1 Tax=Desulfosarcina sp. TaxID=2027861 RepID=UPI0039708753